MLCIKRNGKGSELECFIDISLTYTYVNFMGMSDDTT